MMSFLNALVAKADGAASPEVSQAAGAHMPGEGLVVLDCHCIHCSHS